MNKIPSKKDNPNGLHKRYYVMKALGKTDVKAVYFVLRLDKRGKDKEWSEACRKAARHLITLLPERSKQIGLELESLLNNIELNDK